MGFEPTTSGVTDQRANQATLQPRFFYDGAGTRTLNARIMIPLLYRLSYAANQKNLQGLDLNQRPSGYEPDELPNCSTLHRKRYENSFLKSSKAVQDFTRVGDGI